MFWVFLKHNWLCHFEFLKRLSLVFGRVVISQAVKTNSGPQLATAVVCD